MAYVPQRVGTAQGRIEQRIILTMIAGTAAVAAIIIIGIVGIKVIALIVIMTIMNEAIAVTVAVIKILEVKIGKFTFIHLNLSVLKCWP